MKKSRKIRRDGEGSPFFYKTREYGFRKYDHAKDEKAVCILCWKNSLPGGRPFLLIPEQGAMSFGRIVTGPYVQAESGYFYVAEYLNTGKIIGYATGASGKSQKTPDGTVSWMTWRDDKAEEIAMEEFGRISKQLLFLEGVIRQSEEYLYTTSLGPRAVAFLLHAKKYRKKEMPKLVPDCPEFHFQVVKKHRGKRVGTQLIIHFLEQLPAGRHEKVCMQITACEASKPL
ncbi:MAG: hypothetical protein U9Q81_19515, partial [Pseudomonadota bacterium]|nr:hypothetical protein [Pseudomonadota bacterium]